MKLFQMIREADESGVSGTGHVLDGVVFENGKVAVTWYGRADVKATSVTVFDSFEDFQEIHVSSHPTNRTHIIWQG